MAMHRFIWYVSTTNVSNPFITSAWYTWPLKYEPAARAFLFSWQSCCRVGRLGSTDLLSVALLENCRLAEDCFFSFFAANYLQWAVTPEKGLFYYYYYPAVMFLGVPSPSLCATCRAASSCPRQPGCVGCGGCRFLVVLSPNGAFGVALGLRLGCWT